MNHQQATITALAGILFFYFFLRPVVDQITLVMVVVLWAISLACDLHITFSNKSCISKYEQSFVLLFFYDRLSSIGTISIVISIEITSIVLLPVIFLYEMNLGCSVMVAYFFAVLHMLAVSQNEKFVKEL